MGLDAVLRAGPANVHTARIDREGSRIRRRRDFGESEIYFSNLIAALSLPTLVHLDGSPFCSSKRSGVDDLAPGARDQGSEYIQIDRES